MFLKHGIEVFNFGLQSSSWKPKEYDTDMGKLLVKERHYSIPKPLTDTSDYQYSLVEYRGRYD